MPTIVDFFPENFLISITSLQNDSLLFSLKEKELVQLPIETCLLEGIERNKLKVNMHPIVIEITTAIVNLLLSPMNSLMTDNLSILLKPFLFSDPKFFQFQTNRAILLSEVLVHKIVLQSLLN